MMWGCVLLFSSKHSGAMYLICEWSAGADHATTHELDAAALKERRSRAAPERPNRRKRRSRQPGLLDAQPKVSHLGHVVCVEDDVAGLRQPVVEVS